MKYLKNSRLGRLGKAKQEDPLLGVANLFDVALVFIVALLLSLMASYQILDFFSEKSEITIVKKNENGRMEIITKKGKKVKVEKVTDRKIGGEEGIKLGTAYQLKDGRMVYVPEE